MKVKPITPQEYEANTTRKQTKDASLPRVTSPKIPTPSTDQDVYVKSSKISDPAFGRHLLPSRGFFYENKKDIIFRPFKVGDLKKLQHFLQTDNMSHLIDAVQNCVEPDVDVRSLTVEDFIYVVFRIVFDSHPDPKYRFVWSSFYGNDGEIIIAPSDLEVVELKHKELLAQLPNYKELGLSPVFVKSFEVLHNNQHKEDDNTTWDEEKSWLYKEVGCFLEGDSPEEQLRKAEDLEISSETYQKLSLFKQLIQHSIKTELTVSDQKFEPNEALAKLIERVENLKALKLKEPQFYERLASSNAVMDINDIQEEIDRIQNGLTLSQEVRAKKEVTPFRFDFAGLIEPLFS